MSLTRTGPVAAGGVPAQADGQPAAADLVRQVRVGRQGVYDGERTLIAYELQFRPPRPRLADARPETEDSNQQDLEQAAEQAASHVIAATFGTFGLDAIADGRQVFIDVTRPFLTGVIPIPALPGQVVLQVGAHISADAALTDGIRRLRADGHPVAVVGYAGQPDREPLVKLADYVTIDLTAVPADAVAALAARAAAGGAVLLADRIEDADSLQRALDLGCFQLFRGPALQRPTLLARRMLSPSQLVCLRLLNDLADPDLPIGRIESLVGSDPGLTLRLLRCANSAAGAAREVTSLRQALVLIGPKVVRSWVALTLLEGGTTVGAADALWTVLARAFACQRLAEEQEPDLAFTVGLLSGAAELLGCEPRVVADAAGIAEATRAALLEAAGAAGRVLTAVLGHERDDPDAVAGTGLAPFDVSRVYLAALSDSLQLVHELVPE